MSTFNIIFLSCFVFALFLLINWFICKKILENSIDKSISAFLEIINKKDFQLAFKLVELEKKIEVLSKPTKSNPVPKKRGRLKGSKNHPKRSTRASAPSL